MMPLDKNLVREARQHYRAWNEAKFVHEVLTAGQKTPAQKVQVFLELMSLSKKLQPERSPLMQYFIQEEWESYYARMQRFEERRSECGKRPAAAAD